MKSTGRLLVSRGLFDMLQAVQQQMAGRSSSLHLHAGSEVSPRSPVPSASVAPRKGVNECMTMRDRVLHGTRPRKRL